MNLSSLIVLNPMVLGIVSCYFLVKGTISVSYREIRGQTKGGFWLRDNIIRAKSMIIEKSRSFYGFVLLYISFVLQLIALLLKEYNYEMSITTRLALSIIIALQLMVFCSVKLLIKKRVKSQWIKFLETPRNGKKLKSTGRCN